MRSPYDVPACVCDGEWLDRDVPPPSFTTRLLARLADLAIAATVACTAAGAARLLNPAPLRLVDGLAVLIGVVVFGAVMEVRCGATPAKWLMGIRVVDMRGDRAIGAACALRRNLAVLLDGALFGIISYAVVRRSPRKMHLGDAWAESRVVSVEALPRDLRGDEGRFRSSLSIAIVAAGLLPLLVGLYS